MRARIYNERQRKYYTSEVYGVINRAGDWYIVDDITQKDKVVLVEYLNIKTEPPYEVNVEIIDCNSAVCEEWINLSRFEMNPINAKIRNSKELHYYRGYKKIWEATQALIDLLEKGVADKAKFGLENLSTKLEGWNYIEADSDIEYLMEEYSGFHDAVLKEMSYVSGEYVDNGSMQLNSVGNKQVRLLYNSDWAEEIELILLSPRICHVVPGEENYMSVLFDASMFIRDCMVYFYDSHIEDITYNYSGTYFKALGIMWRYVRKSMATIIYLDDCMLLSKKEYSCWEEVQNEYYEKYKANLPPMSCEEIMYFFEEDYKQEDDWPFSRKRIVDFFKSDELLIQSEFGSTL